MSQQLARTVITIDGLAASGKSTLAKLLAAELGFLHVNTGLLYRASAYLALNEKISIEKPEQLVQLLSNHKFEFNYLPQSGSGLLIDGVECADKLQSLEVASFTSKIAAIPELREALRNKQQQAFPGKNIVAEGRDTGTIIFPEAQVKFFIEGDPLVRASRRARELKGQLSEEELARVTSSVAAELRERDERDIKREVAPLKAAADAIVVDNSKGQLQDTVRMMVKLAKSKI